MELLLYSARDNEVFQRTRWIISNLVNTTKVQVHATPESLGARLRQPLVKPAVAVFLATDEPELARLTQLSPLLDDVRVIVVLPGSQDDAMNRAALQLRPSYFAYADSDLTDLGAVLAKMYQGRGGMLEEAQPLVGHA